MVIYIFGHKNPDTDSVVSAIVYANFMNSKGIQSTAVCLGDINNETKFILNSLKIPVPKFISKLKKGEKIIMMDHNEAGQSIDNLDNLEIEEVIDHHKFNFKSDAPVNIRAEKIGATCSVVFKILKEKNYDLSKAEAKLLISGIISDTLFFRSPTSTEEDKQLVEELNSIAGIKNLEEYSLEMFEAKSNVSHLKAEALIKMDYKEYEFNNKKYGIGVIETTSPKSILNRKKEIIDAIEKLKKKEELEGVLLSVIDILSEHNSTIVAGEHEAEILRAVFGGKEIEHNLYSLGPVISRKKQIIPKLEEHFKT